jgi:hypothetical protein
MENKRTIQRANETKSWFFERINETDKPFAELTKRKRRPKLTKFGRKRG